MKEYIEREDLLSLYEGEFSSDKYHVPVPVIIQNIKDIPAADVRPVVRGYWTNHHTLFTDGDWYCSACGKAITIYMGPDRDDRYSFCPNCGADMRWNA